MKKQTSRKKLVICMSTSVLSGFNSAVEESRRVVASSRRCSNQHPELTQHTERGDTKSMRSSSVNRKRAIIVRKSSAEDKTISTREILTMAPLGTRCYLLRNTQVSLDQSCTFYNEQLLGLSLNIFTIPSSLDLNYRM